jgi:hypothetical protein
VDQLPSWNERGSLQALLSKRFDVRDAESISIGQSSLDHVLADSLGYSHDEVRLEIDWDAIAPPGSPG